MTLLSALALLACRSTVTVDSGDCAQTLWYADADQDGYGGNIFVEGCEQPEGFVADNSDCNDLHAATHPGADELCDGLDNDCDGELDEDATELGLWYADLDLDGYGDPERAVAACEQPSGMVENDLDCDDSAAEIHPDAEELACNGVDEDCDGEDGGLVVDGTDYETIQDAIDDAVDGDAICVSAGTWEEDLRLRSVDGLQVVGAGAHTTTIQGTGRGPVVDIGNSEDMLLQGFTITGGIAKNGAGLLIQDSSATLRDVVSTANRCEASECAGVGLWAEDSELTLEACAFEGNVAGIDTTSSSQSAAGVGAWFRQSEVEASDTHFDGNRANMPNYYPGLTGQNTLYSFGVGVHAEESDLYFSAVTIDRNESEGPKTTPSNPYYKDLSTINGGGLWVGDTDLDWDGGSVSGNFSVPAEGAVGIYGFASGAGVYSTQSDLLLRNVTVSGNRVEGVSDSQGGGLYVSEGSLEMENAIVAGNLLRMNASDTHCTVFGAGMMVHAPVSLSNVSITGNVGEVACTGLTSLYYTRLQGGAVYYVSDADHGFQAVNVDVSDNALTQTVSGSAYNYVHGAAFYNSSSSSSIQATIGFRYSNISDNTPTQDAWYNYDSPIHSDGNISQAPGYTDTSAPDAWDWDLVLSSTSALVDAGDPSLEDPDGTTSDIGSHGGPNAGW